MILTFLDIFSLLPVQVTTNAYALVLLFLISKSKYSSNYTNIHVCVRDFKNISTF